MIRDVILGWLFLAAVLAATIAPAQQPACGPHHMIVAQLEGIYGETRIGGGMANPSVIIDVFANTETGTWSIVRSEAGGMSCLVAAGDNWQSDPETDPQPKGQGT